MKKPLFLILLCLSLCACEVRHNHNKQMMQVRVADDNPTQNDTTTNASQDWENAPLIETPDMVEDEVEMPDEEALEELDRMMQGSAE